MSVPIVRKNIAYPLRWRSDYRRYSSHSRSRVLATCLAATRNHLDFRRRKSLPIAGTRERLPM
jgi:hypothetical protein